MTKRQHIRGFVKNKHRRLTTEISCMKPTKSATAPILTLHGN